MWCQNVLRLDMSLLVGFYLTVLSRLAGGGGRENSDSTAFICVARWQWQLLIVESWLELLIVESWLEGHAAAAGSRGSCWRSQECPAPSPSRVVRGKPCLTLARKHRHRTKWPDTHSFPPGRLARRERHGKSTYECSGTPLLLDYCRLYAQVCEPRRVYLRTVSELAPLDVSFYLIVPGPLACCGWEKRYWSCHPLWKLHRLQVHMCCVDGP